MRPIKRQSTLQGPVVCAGIALHSGEHVRVVMRPAPVGTGLVFVRTDITDRDNLIPVRADAVTGVRNCTTISNAANVSVSTIEHLMAALAAAGIDNLYIDMEGDELPALDGSSEPYMELIEQVGVLSQPAPRRYVKVLKRIEVGENGSRAVIEPSHELSLDVTIDFDDEAIGRQRCQIIPDSRSFREGIASARTFARMQEVEALREAGLSKGGSYDNAIVVDGDTVLNPGGLRYADEFVRHKTLDLLGDLYLGGPILGHVTTVKAGHGINHDLLMALYGDPQAWRFVTITDTEMNKALDSALA